MVATLFGFKKRWPISWDG